MLLVLMNQHFNCLVFAVVFLFYFVLPKHLYLRFKGCPSGRVYKIMRTIFAHVLAEIIFMYSKHDKKYWLYLFHSIR